MQIESRTGAVESRKFLWRPKHTLFVGILLGVAVSFSQYKTAQDLISGKTEYNSVRQARLGALETAIAGLRHDVAQLNSLFLDGGGQPLATAKETVGRSIPSASYYLDSLQTATRLAQTLEMYQSVDALENAAQEFPRYFQTGLEYSIEQSAGNGAQNAGLLQLVMSSKRELDQVHTALQNSLSIELEDSMNVATQSNASMLTSLGLFVLSCVAASVSLGAAFLTGTIKGGIGLKSSESEKSAEPINSIEVLGRERKSGYGVHELQQRAQDFASKEGANRAYSHDFVELKELYTTLDEATETMISTLQLLSRGQKGSLPLASAAGGQNEVRERNALAS